MLKLILPTCLIAAIVALGAALDPDLRPLSTADLPAEDSASAQNGDCIYAPGRVEGLTEEICLRPELQGRIVRIAVAEGDSVAPGAVLLELDSEVQRHEAALCEAQVEIAEAELERLVNGARQEERAEAAANHHGLEAQLTGVRKRLERMTTLRATNTSTQQQVDDLTAEAASLASQVQAAKARLDLLEAPARADEVRRAEANIAVARVRLAMARTQVERTILRAPSSGTVLKIQARLGELCGPSSSEPSVVLADLTRLQIRAFLEEFDAPRVRPGFACTITVDGLPGETFQGRLVRVSPRMSAKQLWTDDPAERCDTKAREAWIELNEVTTLPVGLRVDVIFDSSQAATQTEHR